MKINIYLHRSVYQRLLYYLCGYCNNQKRQYSYGPEIWLVVIVLLPAPTMVLSNLDIQDWKWPRTAGSNMLQPFSKLPLPLILEATLNLNWLQKKMWFCDAKDVLYKSWIVISGLENDAASLNHSHKDQGTAGAQPNMDWIGKKRPRLVVVGMFTCPKPLVMIDIFSHLDRLCWWSNVVPNSDMTNPFIAAHVQLVSSWNKVIVWQYHDV